MMPGMFRWAASPRRSIRDLTGEQQFFLAFGQEWASKTREAAERQQILVDVHAPGEFRALAGPQYRRLVCGVRRQAGPETVSGAAARVHVW